MAQLNYDFVDFFDASARTVRGLNAAIEVINEYAPDVYGEDEDGTATLGDDEDEQDETQRKVTHALVTLYNLKEMFPDATQLVVAAIMAEGDDEDELTLKDLEAELEG